MIETEAIVTRAMPGQVFIKRLQSGGCGGCMQQAGCSTATLAKLLPQREFAVDCDLDLKQGDRVRVAIDDSHLLFSSLLLYLLPLLLMFAGLGLANVLLPEALKDWLPEIALSTLLLAFGLINRFQSVFAAFYLKPMILGKAVGPRITADFSK